MIVIRRLLGLVLASALAGCVSSAIKPDDALDLEPGEGLVGIQFDSLDRITEIQFQRRGGGDTINLAEAQPGVTTHLFRAEPGEYCLYMFHFGDWRIRFGEGGDPLCIEVVAGELRYGGTFTPRVVRGKVSMFQSVGDAEHFERSVRAKYPASERYFKAE
jgi:hypothetical protein